MTIDELLQPRYKLIAGYPKSPYKVGDILSLPWDNSAWFGIIFDEEYAKNIDHIHIKNIKPYPHLFKPLEWWEERRPGEMPDYVKCETGKIIKVKQWQFDGDTEVENTLFFTTDDDELGFYPSKYLPATESDYLTYKSISTQK